VKGDNSSNCGKGGPIVEKQIFDACARDMNEGIKLIIDDFGIKLKKSAQGKIKRYGLEAVVEADDLVEETICEIWLIISQERYPVRLFDYMCGIIDNKCRSSKQKNERRKICMDSYINQSIVDSYCISMEDRIVFRAILMDFINDFSPMKKEYFIRKYLLQEHFGEIARSYEKTPGSVKMATGRMVSLLRELLKNENYFS